MNVSIVEFTMFYKYASCSFHVEAMAYIRRKQSAVVHDDDEMGEYLLASKSEESLSYLEFDSDNQLNDVHFLCSGG